MVPVPRSTLLGVGLRESDPYSRDVRLRANERLGDRFIGIGITPFAGLPKLLAATDIVAIPQRAGPAALGQVPAKLFDAMAMQRPIVASRVKTIEDVVGDTAWLVEPSSPAAIAGAISDIVSRPEEALRRAQGGRERFLARYSFSAARATLASVFARYE